MIRLFMFASMMAAGATAVGVGPFSGILDKGRSIIIENAFPKTERQQAIEDLAERSVGLGEFFDQATGAILQSALPEQTKKEFTAAKEQLVESLELIGTLKKNEEEDRVAIIPLIKRLIAPEPDAPTPSASPQATGTIATSAPSPAPTASVPPNCQLVCQ